MRAYQETKHIDTILILLLVCLGMSDANISCSIIYKIKEERERRTDHSRAKSKINFYLTYEELYQSDTQEHSKINMRDKLEPIQRFASGQKHRKQLSHINHAKKISLNFELFNPKKKQREEGEESRPNYEELLLNSKEKYMEKIEKHKRKRSEKCKNISVFGLNIKTVDRNDEKARPKREGRTKETISHENSQGKIHVQNSLTDNNAHQRRMSVVQHQTKREAATQERSRSFIDHSHLKETSFIKLKVSKMVNSSKVVLQSFGVQLQKEGEERYKFYVGRGNNSNLIKSIMKQRWWWAETNQPAFAQFVWTQLKHQPTIDRQRRACQQPQPLDFFRQQISQTADDAQSQSFFHPQLSKKLQSFPPEKQRKRQLRPFKTPQCVHNHFSHNFMFGNKNALFENLCLYYEYRQEDVYGIIPLTYFVEDCASARFQQFQQAAGRSKNAIWIVKPGENSNRGNGIFVTKSVEQIRRRISRRKQAHTYIIQKYLTNPMLYHRRKFDIRTYLLMLTVAGSTKYFWYREGYLRTSSEPFDLKDLSDFFIHLTNDAVQKKSQAYGKFENGNKVSYSEFQRYLDSAHPGKEYSVRVLNEEMKRIAQIAVRAAYNKLDPETKDYGFELFGLDFILDASFRPWLIEINTNPCLELSSPTLQRLIPRMLENLARISLDPVFQPSEEAPKSKSHFIYESCLLKNRFELIFDSLFDRDPEWEDWSRGRAQRAYEQNQEVFEGEGEEVAAVY